MALIKHDHPRKGRKLTFPATQFDVWLFTFVHYPHCRSLHWFPGLVFLPCLCWLRLPCLPSLARVLWCLLVFGPTNMSQAGLPGQDQGHLAPLRRETKISAGETKWEQKTELERLMCSAHTKKKKKVEIRWFYPQKPGMWSRRMKSSTYASISHLYSIWEHTSLVKIWGWGSGISTPICAAAVASERAQLERKPLQSLAAQKFKMQCFKKCFNS